MSESAYKDANPISGYEVYRSPEFKAFCKRFGVAWGLKTKALTIRLTEDLMTVTQEYVGEEARPGQRSPFIDTTTAHNETFRTVMPRPDHEAERLDR